MHLSNNFIYCQNDIPKEKREYEQLTKDIESLELEKAELESALASGSLNNDELIAKSQRFQEITELLDEKELRWLELDELNS